MCKYLFLAFSFFLLASTLLIAQQAPSAPTPVAPYVQPTPALCHWVMTVTPKTPVTNAAAAQSPISPQIIEIIKTGKKERRNVTLDGVKSSYAFYGGYILGKNNGTAQIVTTSEVNPLYPLYCPGFLFVEVVSLSNYKDYISYKNIPCFHYVSGLNEAWIDAKTMLPVATAQGDDLVSYSFLPTPAPNDVALDADEANIYKLQMEALRRVSTAR